MGVDGIDGMDEDLTEQSLRSCTAAKRRTGFDCEGLCSFGRSDSTTHILCDKIGSTNQISPTSVGLSHRAGKAYNGGLSKVRLGWL